MFLGLLITPAVGAVAAYLFLDFGWRVAFLFGALVTVTGPSVITPLLRSLRVDDRLRDILASEGVIIDPLGALLTLFLLEIAVAESLDPAGPTQWVLERLLIGGGIGAGGALVVYLLSRFVERLSSREVALLVIGGAVATFALAESLGEESGLVAMVVMAIAIGNISLPHRESVHEFQESLTAWLIASVYVLLAAGIRIDDLTALWPEGVIVVASLALIARPLVVVLASFRSGLGWREQAFLSGVAPRGVVAASLAGIVAVEASALAGGGDARELVAMVFVVILLTIGIQSAYAGTLARLLKVQPMTTVVAGAGEVGRRAATLLAGGGEPVLVVETDEAAVMRAREDGLEVLIGDIADAEVLERAGVAEAKALLLATPDDAQNLLAAQLARSKFGWRVRLCAGQRCGQRRGLSAARRRAREPVRSGCLRACAHGHRAHVPRHSGAGCGGCECRPRGGDGGFGATGDPVDPAASRYPRRARDAGPELGHSERQDGIAPRRHRHRLWGASTILPSPVAGSRSCPRPFPPT